MYTNMDIYIHMFIYVYTHIYTCIHILSTSDAHALRYKKTERNISSKTHLLTLFTHTHTPVQIACREDDSNMLSIMHVHYACFTPHTVIHQRRHRRHEKDYVIVDGTHWSEVRIAVVLHCHYKRKDGSHSHADKPKDEKDDYKHRQTLLHKICQHIIEKSARLTCAFVLGLTQTPVMKK